MEVIYAKLNKQLEQVKYKGSITDTAQVTVDESTNTISVDIIDPVNGRVPSNVIKKYLHRIKLKIKSEDNIKSAILFIDFYSSEPNLFTDCVFTDVENVLNDIQASGVVSTITLNSQGEEVTYNTHIYMLSINKKEDNYTFIINNSIEIETYLNYENDWTIEDSIVGYIFHEEEK